MSDREKILTALMDVLGQEGCGASCEEAAIFRDDEGWKMMLEGFMEPWKLGQNFRGGQSEYQRVCRHGIWIEIRIISHGPTQTHTNWLKEFVCVSPCVLGAS
jgi:hypothetical protein